MTTRQLSATLATLFTLLLLPSVPPAGAASIAPPRDLGGLARSSAAVVYAEALESWGEAAGDLPATVTRFLLVEQPAGTAVGTLFEVVEPGGVAEGRGAAVAGAPRYRSGQRYLLFLTPAGRPGNGRWRSQMLAYGLLEEVSGPDGEALLRPLPEAAELALMTAAPGAAASGRAPRAAERAFEPVGVYRRDALLGHLREVARGAAWNRGRAAVSPAEEIAAFVTSAPAATATSAVEAAPAAAALPAVCAFVRHSDNLPVRWFGYETGTSVTMWATTPGQSGIGDGGVSAVQLGTAAWRDHADSVLRLQYGGVRPTGANCGDGSAIEFNLPDVTFNDPCEELQDLSECSAGGPVCCGLLAYGGTFFETGTTSYDGMPWHAAIAPFVLVNDGAQCVGATSFREVIAHELGHTQGFDHHTPANPADALMSGFLKADGMGAAIRVTDKLCASNAYHTFLDVPYSHLFWSEIEAVENAGITNGCGTPGSYCPTGNITRAQMAVFLVRGMRGGSFVPPAATGVFEDVPTTYWAAAYIEQLARDGITKGCSVTPARFCPEGLINRSQMAVFLMRVEHGVAFVPPPATGTIFGDVPASYWAGAEIEQVYRDGISNGCSASPAQFCPESQVNRGSMAAFLARVFDLPLP